MTGEEALRCRCGRPVADAFLCWDCTGMVRVDLAALLLFVPELTTLLARQARTSGGGRPRAGSEADVDGSAGPGRSIPAQLRTADGQVALRATALGFDVAASDTLVEVRTKLFGWCKSLAEGRGKSLADVLAAA